MKKIINTALILFTLLIVPAFASAQIRNPFVVIPDTNTTWTIMKDISEPTKAIILIYRPEGAHPTASTLKVSVYTAGSASTANTIDLYTGAAQDIYKVGQSAVEVVVPKDLQSGKYGVVVSVYDADNKQIGTVYSMPFTVVNTNTGANGQWMSMTSPKSGDVWEITSSEGIVKKRVDYAGTPKALNTPGVTGWYKLIDKAGKEYGNSYVTVQEYRYLGGISGSGTANSYFVSVSSAVPSGTYKFSFMRESGTENFKIYGQSEFFTIKNTYLEKKSGDSGSGDTGTTGTGTSGGTGTTVGGSDTTSQNKPTAKLSIDGVKDRTFKVGSTRKYDWSSTNADTFSSKFTSNDVSKCGSSDSWIANTANGTYSYTPTSAETNLANCVLTVTYTAKDSKSGLSASDSVNVRLVADQTSQLDQQAPTIPQNVIATVNSNNQVVLTWSQSVDNVYLTGYKIYRNGVQIFSRNSQAQIYTDSNLPNGTYKYTISSYDSAGNISSPSKEAIATLPYVDTQNVASSITLTTPKNMTYQNGYSVAISWTSAGKVVTPIELTVYTANGQQVEKYTSNVLISGTATSDKLPAGQYKIIAKSANGITAESPIFTISNPIVTTPTNDNTNANTGNQTATLVSVSSISPSSGVSGTSVTLTGTGFSKKDTNNILLTFKMSGRDYSMQFSAPSSDGSHLTFVMDFKKYRIPAGTVMKIWVDNDEFGFSDENPAYLANPVTFTLTADPSLSKNGSVIYANVFDPIMITATVIDSILNFLK